jgi:hypothetical protein
VFIIGVQWRQEGQGSGQGPGQKGSGFEHNQGGSEVNPICMEQMWILIRCAE